VSGHHGTSLGIFAVYASRISTMALKWPGEGIILPEEPLFLVQKGWKAKHNGETSLVRRAELHRQTRTSRGLGEASRRLRRRPGENNSGPRGSKHVHSEIRQNEHTSGRTSRTGEEKPVPAPLVSVHPITASLSPVGHDSLYVNYCKRVPIPETLLECSILNTSHVLLH
jgi:hypothetical protein